nr:MAG TPA: hypothetical protein [Caudoviricetes sp.]
MRYNVFHDVRLVRFYLTSGIGVFITLVPLLL